MADAAATETITNAAEEKPAPRSRVRLPLMIGVPLLILAVAGYFWLTSGRYIDTDNAYVKSDMVSISPDVSGRIVAVAVRENQRVKKGDLLFRIDPEPYRIALAQAEAQIASARVQISTLETSVDSAAIDISGAREDVSYAEQNFARQAALLKRGFTTRARYDDARHALREAQEQVRSDEAEAARARSQLGSGGGAQPAALQAALVARDKALLDLQRTEVRAPSDGIVSQTDRLQVGQILPSGVPAVTIVAGTGIWVEANYKETDLDTMQVGQAAEIELDAYPDLKIKGHVASIGAGTGSEFSVLPSQNANGNWVKVTQRVPVRIAVDGTPPRAMIAGLSADVSIDTKAR